MNKKELLLYVDELNRPRKVLFGKALESASAHSGNVGDALLGLHFLIAINHLSRENEELARVYLNMERAVLLIKKLYEVVRKKDDKNWIINRYFKKNAQKIFSKISSKEIQFTNQIYPRVVEKDDLYIGDLSKIRLVSLIEGLLGICSGENLIEDSVMGGNGLIPGSKRILIELRVSRGGSDLMKINNIGSSGYVIKEDAFDILIYSNYPVHFCVVWLDAESRCYELYPRINEDRDNLEDIGDECLEIDYIPSETGERTLIVPANQSLKINTDRGMESCIVLTSPREFDFTEIDKLKKRISKVAEASNVCQGKGNFNYRHEYLEDEKMPTIGHGLELGVACPARVWVKDLVKQMHGFGNEIHILSIPHAPLLR